MQRFADRVAVVTGGSRGIGLGTARRLADEGAHVVLVARGQEALLAAREQIEKDGGTASTVVADVTRPGDLEAVRDQVRAAVGPVDALAAFAGGGGEPAALADLPPERWREIIDANLTATYLTVAAFLPAMMDRGTGAVLTMSSSAGRAATEANAAYAAAKGGVIAFTRQAAMHAAGHGVRVNAVAPGSVLNDRLAAMPIQVREKVAALHPLGRIGTPQDVAAAAAFLLSEDAGWITGVTLDVAGGRIM